MTVAPHLARARLQDAAGIERHSVVVAVLGGDRDSAEVPEQRLPHLPRAPGVVLRIEDEEHRLHRRRLAAPLAREVAEAHTGPRGDQKLVEFRLVALGCSDLAAVTVVAVAEAVRQVAQANHHRGRPGEIDLAGVAAVAAAARGQRHEQQREPLHAATGAPANARRSWTNSASKASGAWSWSSWSSRQV